MRNDMVGVKYGRLTILSLRGQVVSARCDCGAITECAKHNVLAGRTRSCGCGRRGNKTNYIHGLSNTPEFNSWRSAKGRCFNPHNRAYRHYGGRGITMCSDWASSFLAFLRDMGEKPSGAYELDRVNNNGHYEPGNCRWATAKQQSNNRRSNRYLSAFGATATVAEWAAATGTPADRIKQRINKLGWSGERAISEEIEAA